MERPPWWMRARLDLLALAAGAVVYWQASRNGYQLVLAPEGLPQVQVNWYALLAPVLFWIGGGLLAYRLADLLLAHGRPLLRRGLRPLAGELSATVAATMGRRRRALARALTLVALTVAFAGSVSVFNSTYAQQAEVDARLTNGADVTVTESPGAGVGAQEASKLTSIPGVASVEPLQHRFAYVGSDLQDLYGVRPATIGAAGQLQDAWFQGGTADQLMSTLAQQPNSILVSAETVRDFQLHPGDRLRLRLQNGLTKQYRTVTFRYAGIAKEFPTAPLDSFLVANAGYVARQTGSDAVGSFLIQTDGTDPATVAARVRSTVGPGAKVTDITSSRKVIGTSLTSVELSGLTTVELAFGLILAAASTGLLLGLGFAERRRSFAIAAALGARAGSSGPSRGARRAWSRWVASPSGAAIAAGLSIVLVKVLTGVFDPPPDSLSSPGATSRRSRQSPSPRSSASPRSCSASCGVRGWTRSATSDAPARGGRQSPSSPRRISRASSASPGGTRISCAPTVPRPSPAPAPRLVNRGRQSMSALRRSEHSSWASGSLPATWTTTHSSPLIARRTVRHRRARARPNAAPAAGRASARVPPRAEQRPRAARRRAGGSG